MQQTNIPLSLNDLNLPVNPLNVMTPITPAPITEENSQPPTIDGIPIQEELFDVSDISTPSTLPSSVNVWDTSLDVGTFYSLGLRQIISCIEPIFYAAVTNKTEAKIEHGNEFAKKKDHHCTPVRPAVNPCQQKTNPMLRMRSGFYFKLKFENYYFICIVFHHTCTPMPIIYKSPLRNAPE